MEQYMEEINGEIIEYVCSHCGSKAWKLSILHDHDDNKTFLLVQCSNEQCLQTREMLLQENEDEPIGWDCFDITGQGYDPEDVEGIVEEKMVN